jgi:hypothetical protein
LVIIAKPVCRPHSEHRQRHIESASDRKIIEKVTARYKFLKSPSLVSEETTKTGYRFEAGQITVNGALERITDFSIYRDGIVINSAKTDNSEALLDDVIGYMKDEISYRDFITPPRRYFQSQIVVEFDRSPEKLIVPFDKIAAAISEPLKEIYGGDIPMKFGRLDFAADKLKLSAAAFRAISLRFAAVIDLARAAPPFRPNAAAAGSFPCSSDVGSRSSTWPVAISTMRLAH